jgi:RNA-directed DNA polymerase
VGLSSVVGRDGTKRDAFSEKLNREIELVLAKVEAQNYRFTGYKETLISKGARKNPRQISIPTVRDRLTLRAVCEILSAVFSDCKTSPPHEYIKSIKKLAAEVGEGYRFLRMDIKSYYPSIDQDILLRRIRRRIRKPQVISLIESAIKTPTGKRNIPENLTLVGVPQGLSISNILSSVYLAHIDAKYKRRMHFFRYVDDILILCKSSDANQIYDDLKADIWRTARLECHTLDRSGLGKTTIERIADGIDYLGFRITDKSVSVRPSSYNRMFANLIKVFTQYKYKRNKARFLWRLNLKITGCFFEGRRFGWMFFFSQTENTSQLKRLDFFVNNLAQKYKIGTDAGGIKSFIKSYHEIRFNADNTKYIPDFETYSRDPMIEFICLLSDREHKDLTTLDDHQVRKLFKKLASREVAQLEKDLIEVFFLMKRWSAGAYISFFPIHIHILFVFYFEGTQRMIVMAMKSDLVDWVVDALRARGGSGTIVDVCRHVWDHHESDLRSSGNLFFTWQYDIRWAANELRRSDRMKPVAISPKGRWEIT